MTDPHTPTRRQVLLTSGTVVAAAAVTAACGSSGSSGTPTTAGAAGGGGASVAKSEVPVGGGAILADAQVVVTQPQEGTFKAFTAICTHQGCLVSAVADDTITCACHGSQFSAADGSVVRGPATSPLAPLTATVKGDTITVA